MKDREELQQEIENARMQLDRAFAAGEEVEVCYRLSKALDELLEEYIDLEEYDREKVLLR